MKQLFLAALATLAMNAAHAAKACEELKTEIAAKLDAAGVKNYTLEVSENNKVSEGKVIGSCDGGTKKVIYTKKQ